jgi:hypothetical protein
MKLALFTPGAYIWPVHRSLEAFLASLCAPARDELSVMGSPVYPATFEAEPPLSGMPPRLDARLMQLHRDLYDMMLRPLHYFEREERCLADYLWPDLRETSIGQLLEAFLYYFTRRTSGGVSTLQGLSVIRAAFFNHEQAEPEHWIHSSERRLAQLRDTFETCSHSFTAPPATRVQDLAFVVHSALERPPTSAGWITGTIRRWPDGLCHVETACGYDPAVATAEQRLQAAPRLAGEMQAVLHCIFGWAGPGAEAAA